MVNDYDDDDRHRMGPATVMAALVAIELAGGDRGRAALRRLRALTGWGALALIASAFVAPLVGGEMGRIYALVLGVCSLAAGVFWCHAAFASWLTR
jgi:uncharacterized membrane protein